MTLEWNFEGKFSLIPLIYNNLSENNFYSLSGSQKEYFWRKVEIENSG